MSDRLTHFKWFTGSPEWIRHGEDWYLAEKIGAPRNLYRPLAEHTGLYRNFTNTPLTRAGILAFATQYGLLGIGQYDSVIATAEPVYYLEEFGQWKREIELLKLAERLRDAYKTRKFEGVKNLFSRDIEAIIFRRDGSPPLRFVSLDGAPPMDLFVATGRAIQELVNQKLDGDVSSRLLWNASYTELGLHRVPRHLLGAMWLQFARAVEGDRDFAKCEACKNEFEINSSEGARSDKKYCSNACRARAWRKDREAHK